MIVYGLIYYTYARLVFQWKDVIILNSLVTLLMFSLFILDRALKYPFYAFFAEESYLLTSSLPILEVSSICMLDVD